MIPMHPETKNQALRPRNLIDIFSRKLKLKLVNGSGSMSSIKRDVKKKLLPRPESRCFLEIQPAGIRLRYRNLTCAHSDKSSLVS